MTASVNQLYEQWFQIADEDRDNTISGGEAVKFLFRSGLSQAVLGQIWELSSGGASHLSRPQFAAAMRLCAMAQAGGGVLNPEGARAMLAGVGPQLPPPRMSGLEVAPPQQQPVPAAAAYPPIPQAPQHHQQYMPQTQQQQQQPTQQQAASQAGAIRFPPATAADLQRYGTMFTQLDKDKTGAVKGGDCFGFFMQWGLDKSVLRDIWALVAGDAGQLNRDQWVKAIYLMDMAVRGTPPPAQLPPPPFPPVAAPPVVAPASAVGSPAPTAPWSLHSQYNTPPAPFQNLLPPVPVQPERLSFPQDGFPSGVKPPEVPTPVVPMPAAAVMASLAQEERAKLEAEEKAVSERLLKQREAENEMAMHKARLVAYNTALSDITVFKSRTEVALMTAQDSAERLGREVAAVAARYEQAYAASASQNEAGRKAREHVISLMASKAEGEERLRVLGQELAVAEGMSPEEVTRLEAEVAVMESDIAARAAVRDSRQAQMDAVQSRKVALLRRLAEMQATSAESDAQLSSTRKEVKELQKDARKAFDNGDSSGVGHLLVHCARIYSSLHNMALQAGTEVPFEAKIPNMGLSRWMEDVLTGAADWDDDSESSRGYVLVNAVQGQSVPRSMPKVIAAPKPKPAIAIPTHAPTPSVSNPSPQGSGLLPAATSPATSSRKTSFPESETFEETFDSPSWSTPTLAPPAPIAVPTPAQRVGSAAPSPGTTTTAAFGFSDDAFGGLDAFSAAPAWDAPSRHDSHASPTPPASITAAVAAEVSAPSAAAPAVVLRQPSAAAASPPPSPGSATVAASPRSGAQTLASFQAEAARLLSAAIAPPPAAAAVGGHTEGTGHSLPAPPAYDTFGEPSPFGDLPAFGGSPVISGTLPPPSVTPPVTAVDRASPQASPGGGGKAEGKSALSNVDAGGLSTSSPPSHTPTTHTPTTTATTAAPTSSSTAHYLGFEDADDNPFGAPTPPPDAPATAASAVIVPPAAATPSAHFGVGFGDDNPFAIPSQATPPNVKPPPAVHTERVSGAGAHTAAPTAAAAAPLSFGESAFGESAFGDSAF